MTNVVPILADAEGNISLDDEFVEAAFGVAVISEIPNPISALHEIRRILKLGGFLASSEIFMDPDFPLGRTMKR